MELNMSVFLHVGCGPTTKKDLKGFNSDEWNEIRFDIDEKVAPDIVGTLTDMSSVESSSVDAIYSSHNIEHIYSHEIQKALNEFHRVLKPEGIAVVTCPDLQSVCEAVAMGKLLEPLYVSQAGPVSAIDILYGHRASLAAGNDYMSHKCGFTFPALSDSFIAAGFKSTFGGRRPAAFDIWLVAFKGEVTEEEMKRISSIYLP
jgi:SAM-dependent methyltransferase